MLHDINSPIKHVEAMHCNTVSLVPRRTSALGPSRLGTRDDRVIGVADQTHIYDQRSWPGAVPPKM
jgi:hypothetical protein